MATATTLQPLPVPPQPANHPNPELADAVLGLVLASMYGASLSKKSLRKLKRKLVWASLKAKAKSLFKKNELSDRTLLYILIGIALLAFIILAPIPALIVILILLVLYLAGIINFRF